MANELCISGGVSINRPKTIQFRTALRKLLLAHSAEPTLHLPLLVFQLPPLRRRAALIELQPFQNVPSYLKHPHAIIACDLSDLLPYIFQNRNRLSSILIRKRSYVQPL